MGKINLLCLPYAGGSACVYNKWQKDLDENYVMKPIELSGRGMRFGEELKSDFKEVIADIYDEFKNCLLYTSNQCYEQ